ncbi:hypothetical protein ACJX0J_025405, partial [Zea mays]
FVEQLFLKFPSKLTPHPPSSSAHRVVFAACDDHCSLQSLRRRLNTSYLILQAMTMWGNDRRMEFVR